MQVQDIFSASIEQSTSLSRAELQKKRLEEKTSPLSNAWGRDRVSISDEARAAQAAAQSTASAFGLKDSNAVDGAATKNEGESGGGSVAEADFATYMKKSRSRALDVSPEEELKDLQDKLKSLQSQLAKISTADAPDTSRSGPLNSLNSQVSAHTSDASKSVMAENLNAQITTIMEKIAEVSARVAAQKTKDAGKAG